MSPSTGNIDPNDISNGYYPHLRKVGPNDPEFLDVIAWLQSKGAPRTTRLEAYPWQGDGVKANPFGPAQIVWSDSTKAFTALALDAALVFNFPHVALIDLKTHFGFGDPNVLEYYHGMRVHEPARMPNPIGVPWPEQGSNAYRPGKGDNDTLYPIGATWADTTGLYVKEQRGWVFVRYPVWVKVN